MLSKSSIRLTCIFVLVLMMSKPLFPQFVGPSSEDKSVIYFFRGYVSKIFDTDTLNSTRPSYFHPPKYHGNIPLIIVGGNTHHLHGVIIYDSATIVVELFEGEYIRYECNPGYHLFWAPGKRNEYLEAELLPGKVYFIDVSIKNEKNSANLRPINPENEFWVDGIRSFVSEQPSKCYSEKSLQKAQKRKRKEIAKGLARMQEHMDRGKQIEKLEKEMFYFQTDDY